MKLKGGSNMSLRWRLSFVEVLVIAEGGWLVGRVVCLRAIVLILTVGEGGGAC